MGAGRLRKPGQLAGRYRRCRIEHGRPREWIRIGRRVRESPAIADAFGDGTLSYSKVRTLSRVATTDNEAVLIAVPTALAMRTRTRPDASEGYPTLAQQHADALESLLTDGAGTTL